MNWKERLQKQNPEEIVPFVDGWDFVGILGEGAFGEVRLGTVIVLLDYATKRYFSGQC